MSATTFTSESIVTELSDTVGSELENSAFWSAFTAGELPLEHVSKVFQQYYLWRNTFHRWFGVCIAKSPAFGSSYDTDYILRELSEHIEEEVTGDHHGLALQFLKVIGVDNPQAIEPLPVTTAYENHFAELYLAPERTGQESLAALAGRELVAPLRNRLTLDAFQDRYGITESLEFFHLHEELEVEHFRGLWGAVATRSEKDRKLVEAAKDQIVRHVRFWDDVHAAV
ncbi:iron-containing redox enzyme family protein [Streptomyces sp. WMMC1477]|uniref:iron-containing redox enzyme family protein n=1 Tax=Streptomyces sp. WMMC1477 TaxID=3015155 RepID=UPI0022B6D810|nr:iron-containing redox enzyme family protein [Streptomyces sp. WMMC1477]MCZ7430961.1 iron-containing redox enzyme family protein [Streptomyces sp. WMMC1477]